MKKKKTNNPACQIHRKSVEWLEKLACNWPLEISPRTYYRTGKPGDLFTLQDKWRLKIHKLTLNSVQEHISLDDTQG